MRRQQNAPVEEAFIRDTTLEGKGVAQVDGKAVFIPFTVPGEQVRFQRRRRKRKFDEAELVQIVAAGASRVDPPCPSFGICGGCSLQHISQPAQLALKHDALLQALRRLGNVVPDEVAEPLADISHSYRRRARLGVKYVDRKERVLVGFRERNKPYIVDMQDCATLVPELAHLLPVITRLIGELSISRRLPQVELSRGDKSSSAVFRVLEAPDAGDMERFRAFARYTGVGVWLQPGGPDSLQALDPAAVQSLSYALPEFGLTLEFGPLDFIQVNSQMNRRMLQQAMDWLQPTADDHVLDMFCGIGNFSLPLAQRAAQVTGIELEPDMVARAAANAALNGIDNVRFVAADLAVTGDSGFHSLRQDCSAVLLDPPRTGAREILPAIAALKPARILYVSCHPGSLARDADLLVHEHGYRLARAGAMDMFPQTSHVEAMALFVREKD